MEARNLIVDAASEIKDGYLQRRLNMGWAMLEDDPPKDEPFLIGFQLQDLSTEHALLVRWGDWPREKPARIQNTVETCKLCERVVAPAVDSVCGQCWETDSEVRAERVRRKALQSLIEKGVTLEKLGLYENDRKFWKAAIRTGLLTIIPDKPRPPPTPRDSAWYKWKARKPKLKRINIRGPWRRYDKAMPRGRKYLACLLILEDLKSPYFDLALESFSELAHENLPEGKHRRWRKHHIRLREMYRERKKELARRGPTYRVIRLEDGNLGIVEVRNEGGDP